MNDLHTIKRLNDPREPWIKCLDAWFDNVSTHTLVARSQGIMAELSRRLVKAGYDAGDVERVIIGKVRP